MSALLPTFDQLVEQMPETVAWYDEWFPGPPPGKEKPGELPGLGFFPYQLEAALRRERAVELTFCGYDGPKTMLELWARRAGKNELDARFSHRVMSYFGGLRLHQKRPMLGALVSAPTWDQIDQSKRRLEQTLELLELLSDLVKREGKFYSLRGLKAGIMFKSVGAGPNAKGEGAELYQVVNECQDTDKQTYDDSLAPMRAQTNAPVMFQGTQGAEDCLSNVMLEVALELEEMTGEKLVHLVDGNTVADHNPRYGLFLDTERARLGEHHPIYLMNYRMLAGKGHGRFLDRPEYEGLMRGNYPHREKPVDGAVYVAGVDCSGSAETETQEGTWDPDRTEKRDSTVVTIGSLRFKRDAEGYVPILDIVSVRLWPNMWPDTVTREVMAELDKFPLVKVVVDAGGVGDNLAAAVVKRYGDSRSEALKSGGTDVSRMGDRMLGCIASGRLRMFKRPEETCSNPHCGGGAGDAWPSDDCEPDCKLRTWQEWWLQFRQLRAVRTKNTVRWHAPTKKVNGKTVHDDMPKSCGYLVEAAYDHLKTYNGPVQRVDYLPWDEAQSTVYAV